MTTITCTECGKEETGTVEAVVAWDRAHDAECPGAKAEPVTIEREAAIEAAKVAWGDQWIDRHGRREFIPPVRDGGATDQCIRATVDAVLALAGQPVPGTMAEVEARKVGDPDDTPDVDELYDAGEEYCAASSNGGTPGLRYTCTLVNRHGGSHIAGNGHTILAVWQEVVPDDRA